MFCKNCGNQVSGNDRLCPYCGVEVSREDDSFAYAASTDTPADIAPEPIDPVELEAPKSSKAKLIIIIAAIATVVVAAIVTVILLMGTGSGSINDEDSTCEDEVIAYLDYLADQSKDANGFITDAYFGGEFGRFYSGDEAEEMHKLLAQAAYKNYKDDADMGYGYGYYEYDSWKEFIKEGSVNEFYDDMEYEYGDWDLTYEITDTRELSDSKRNSLEDMWEDVIDSYDDFTDRDSFLSRKDKKEIEEFIETLEEMEIDEAYTVEVKIEIDGDDDSYEEHDEFTVAKIGDNWVILEGPTFDDFIHN